MDDVSRGTKIRLAKDILRSEMKKLDPSSEEYKMGEKQMLSFDEELKELNEDPEDILDFSKVPKNVP